jgi:hypothetical protein
MEITAVVNCPSLLQAWLTEKDIQNPSKYTILSYPKNREPALIMEEKHFRFTKPAVIHLNYAPFAKILMDEPA